MSEEVVEFDVIRTELVDVIERLEVTAVVVDPKAGACAAHRMTEQGGVMGRIDKAAHGFVAREQLGDPTNEARLLDTALCDVDGEGVGQFAGVEFLHHGLQHVLVKQVAGVQLL